MKGGAETRFRDVLPPLSHSGRRSKGSAKSHLMIAVLNEIIFVDKTHSNCYQAEGLIAHSLNVR